MNQEPECIEFDGSTFERVDWEQEQRRWEQLKRLMEKQGHAYLVTEEGVTRILVVSDDGQQDDTNGASR